MLGKNFYLLMVFLLYSFSLKPTYLVLSKPLNTDALVISKICESIVVLGGKYDYDRILKGLELKNLNQSLIIFSGVNSKYKQVIDTFGLKNTIFENSSLNTFENAKNTKEILKRNKINNTCLVTSNSHLYRAKKVFERHNLNIIPISSNEISQELSFSSFLVSIKYLQLNINILYEYMAIIYYKLNERI